MFNIRPCAIALTIVGVLAASTAYGQAEPPKSYKGYAVVTVTAGSEAQAELALDLSESIWSERSGVGQFQVVASPEQLDALIAAGLAPVIDIPDLEPMIVAEQLEIALLAQAKSPWFHTYHRTAEIHTYLHGLADEFPNLASMQSIGSSLQNRDLPLIRITGPGDASDRPAIFLNGGQHAREWISSSTVMYIADQLLRQYGTDPLTTELVDRLEWIILPLVNPDGYEFTWDSTRLWRKNRRNNNNGTFGVDLNRNWDIDFGGEGSSGNTNSDIYRGPFAFSEPETTAIRDFMADEPRIIAHIDFHSFSQLILYPWGYAGAPSLSPSDLAFYSGLSGDMSDAILAQFGAYYTPQPSIDLYPAAGTLGDWTADQGNFGWTLELRPTLSAQGGFILPATDILPVAIENLEAVKVMSAAMLYPFAITPSRDNPQVVGPWETGEVSFAIRAITPEVPMSGTPMLHARQGTSGSFIATPMQHTGGNTWTAMLPKGVPCWDTEYFVRVEASDGRTQTFPLHASSQPLVTRTLSTVSSFFDDMETDAGWTVGAPGDTAVRGIWNRMAPQATPAQPGNDASPTGTLCWVTDGRAGNGVGAWDVDGGTTTLTSPAISAIETNGTPIFGEIEAYISFARWYSNDQGAAPRTDAMPILISTDNGQTWLPLEYVGENANAWVRRTFRLRDLAEPTNAFRVRFVAIDDEPGSIVEAAVDDLQIDVRACTGKPGDIADDFGLTASEGGGPDGVVDFGDFAALLGLLGPCPGGIPACTGDIADDFGLLGPDGVVDFGDFAALLGLIG